MAEIKPPVRAENIEKIRQLISTPEGKMALAESMHARMRLRKELYRLSPPLVGQIDDGYMEEYMRALDAAVERHIAARRHFYMGAPPAQQFGWDANGSPVEEFP